MKLFAKLSALGAVLVVGSAFAAADTVTFGSYGTLNGQDGVAPVLGPNQNVAVTYQNNPAPIQATYNIGSDGASTWAPAGPHSSWISYNPQTGPTGNFIAPNGTYTYLTSFTIQNGGLYNGTLTVLADDTTSVWLDGSQIIAPGTIGSNAHCADGQPNCLVAATFVFSNYLLLGGGIHTLEFDVQQTGLVYEGLDFYGSITSESPVPEPGTLMLLGTGLIGSASTLMRRIRKA